MDTNIPHQPTGNDFSFQVMPRGDMPTNRPPMANNPMPPKPPSGEDMMIPPEPQDSFFRSKLFYIILGLIVLAVLGVLAYFFLGAKKSSQPSAPVSKLSKVWLNQYFNSETCADQTTCGEEADPDTDGLTNYEESRNSTNPLNPDTDSDGLADGDEINVYQTDPTLKYTDRREIVVQNDWTDGYQVKSGYDPLDPGRKINDLRRTQINDAVAQYNLHEPTITTLKSNTTNTPSATVAATIQDSSFSPSTLTINKGDVVVWTNKDSMAHTVTGDKNGPSSDNILPNGTYSFTFDTTGTFTYHCSLHPNMTGTVVVK